MPRPVRWAAALVASLVAFGVCLWAARSAPWGWMPKGEADRWVVAAAFATVAATVVAAAVGWWAGREQQPPSSDVTARHVSQRAKVSGRGQAAQVGGSQNPSAATPASAPGRIKQRAEVSDEASVTQVGGDQHTRAGDDEQRPRT